MTEQSDILLNAFHLFYFILGIDAKCLDYGSFVYMIYVCIYIIYIYIYIYT